MTWFSGPEILGPYNIGKIVRALSGPETPASDPNVLTRSELIWNRQFSEYREPFTAVGKPNWILDEFTMASSCIVSHCDSTGCVDWDLATQRPLISIATQRETHSVCTGPWSPSSFVYLLLEEKNSRFDRRRWTRQLNQIYDRDVQACVTLEASHWRRHTGGVTLEASH